jgi:hypothetical protein
MVFGKLRRVWEKIKGGVKSIWNKLKPAVKKLAPVAGTIGTAIGGALGGTAGAVAGAKIGGAVGGVMGDLANGKSPFHLNGGLMENLKSKKQKLPSWLSKA